MFGKRKSPIRIGKLSSLVAPGMEIIGDVRVADGLRVDGHIKGNVLPASEQANLLVLSDRGSIHGNVTVHDAVINGTIVGDLDVTHFLELQENARITGNIRYRQIRMSCGAAVDGKLSKVGEGRESEEESNVIELATGNAGK